MLHTNKRPDLSNSTTTPALSDDKICTGINNTLR
jgi:hypothetical protein